MGFIDVIKERAKAAYKTYRTSGNRGSAEHMKQQHRS